MKTKLFLSVLIALCIFSCKKDNYEDMLRNTESTLSVDYRDSVVGVYTGRQIHTFYSSQFNLDITDTTYAVLVVSKDSLTTDEVIITGFPEWESQIHNQYDQVEHTLHGVNQLMPHAEGNFVIASPVRLIYTHGHINMGGTSIYSFDLVKL